MTPQDVISEAQQGNGDNWQVIAWYLAGVIVRLTEELARERAGGFHRQEK